MRKKLALSAASLLAALVLASCGGHYYAYAPPPAPYPYTYGYSTLPPGVYSTVPPGPGYMWSYGYWGYVGGHRMWIPGRWIPEPGYHAPVHPRGGWHHGGWRH